MVRVSEKEEGKSEVCNEWPGYKGVIRFFTQMN